MEREEMSNFSTEDAENVTVPESLGPTAWEFFGTLMYRTKKIEAVSLVTECFKIFSKLNQIRPDFLHNEHRFEHKIFPVLEKLMEGKRRQEDTYSTLELRLIAEGVDLTQAVLAYKERQVSETFRKHVHASLASLKQSLIKHRERYDKQISKEVTASLIQKLNF